MRRQFGLFASFILFVLILPSPMAAAQAAIASPNRKSDPAQSGVVPKVCERCIRAHEEFLASDAMQGRGSGTHDELVAATYVASQLRQYGIEPAGDNGGYIQRLAIRSQKDAKHSHRKKKVSPGMWSVCCAAAIHRCNARRFCSRLTWTRWESVLRSTVTISTTARMMTHRGQQRC